MFFQSYSAQVFQLGQQVLVDGVFRPDVVCLSVNSGSGTEGTSASLQVPSSDWDSGADWWKGKFIQVYALGNGSHQTFAGWVTRATGSTSSRMIELEALSPLALSDRTIVGLGMGNLVVSYPQKAIAPDGAEQETGWDVRSILADVLSGEAGTWKGGGGGLPGPWRSRIALGNTGALNRTFNQAPLGDIVCRQMSFKALLDQLLALIGTISVRERFRGQIAFLDFFELGRGFGRKDLRIARTGEAAVGSWILEASQTISDEGQVAGVRAVGGFDKCVSSIWWDPADEQGNDLIPMWESVLEPFVLADPGLATGKSGSPSSALALLQQRPQTKPEELHKVFRRFRLPRSLDNFAISEELGVKFDDGSEASAWAFVEESNLERLTEAPFPGDPGSPQPFPAVSITPGAGDFEGIPGRIESVGYKLLPGRIIEFDRPLVRVAWQAVDGNGKAQTRYVRARGAVTLAFVPGRLEASAGSTLDPPAMVEVVFNDSFARVRVRPDGSEWPDRPALVLGPTEADEFLNQTTVQDDSRALRDFCSLSFKERQKPLREYQLSIPWFSAGVLVGDSIYLYGQADADAGPHVVQSVSWDMSNDHRTSLSTTSTLSLVASSILGGEI